MATDKQIAANQANAKRSTGPKTEEGKAASSKNAVKHGALSSIAVAEHEDAALFESMLASLVREHDPATTIEHQLVERLAVLFWREIRLAKAEAFETKANQLNVQAKAKLNDMISNDPLGSLPPRHYRALENILPIEVQLLVGRYQTMLSNQITQTLKQLREEQELRQQTIEAIPPDKGYRFRLKADRIFGFRADRRANRQTQYQRIRVLSELIRD